MLLLLAAMQLPHREKSIMGQICWFERGLGTMDEDPDIKEKLTIHRLFFDIRWTCREGDGGYAIGRVEGVEMVMVGLE